jgi:hypothetical protein
MDGLNKLMFQLGQRHSVEHVASDREFPKRLLAFIPNPLVLRHSGHVEFPNRSSATAVQRPCRSWPE